MGMCFHKKNEELISEPHKIQQTFFELEAEDIDGNFVKMSEYQNYKAIIITNVACKWGLTGSQYKALCKLYEKYKDQGLMILAFPCNQFMSQEPWEKQKIKEFVNKNFKVAFPLFGKVEVNGENCHPIFKYFYILFLELGWIFFYFFFI